MKVTVEMDNKEFLRFQDFLNDKSIAKQAERRLTLLAKKVMWSIKIDDEKEGKVKIDDHEHAIELLEMAEEYLEEGNA